MIRARHQLTFQGFMVIAMVTGAVIISAPLIDSAGFPLTAILKGAIGLLAQAFPFLLIGVLVSGAIAAFLTRDFIERRFPKSFGAGMAVSLTAGFAMPVCDCATVPVFARMVRKGIPLPSAVVFLCAAPIINPVVIWSTWFAFPDRPLLTISRVGLGILVSLAIGASFALIPVRSNVLRTGINDEADGFGDGADTAEVRLHDAACDSRACEDAMGSGAPDPAETPGVGVGVMDRVVAMMRHAHDDLFRVVPYMLVGIFLASSLRVLWGSKSPAWLTHHSVVISIALMMALAFLSSLCSSSDAVIARGFATMFPTPALLGFLVFGPIMDVKNVLMLSSMFSRRFVVRLAVTSAIIVFAVTALIAGVVR
ncbi:permease [Bifidobacterium sp.]|uniref:permease n=1 Tax=Bifidobacterium sp. TaxID=41200 RepID=UPI0025C274EA|nr:permease [Bifidobacterium sp.]MCH4209240.1 permease [Bifidobacterium sp.]